MTKKVLDNGDMIVTDDDEAEPIEYHIKKDEIVPASMDAIRTAAAGSFRYLVWPDDEPQWSPLLLDMTTARALMTVYGALNEPNREKFENIMIQRRIRFIKLVDFCWDRVTVSFGGQE